VVASRANYARIKSVLTALSHRDDISLHIVVSASALLERFGKIDDQIKRDGFRIDFRAYVVVEGENPTTMAKSTGLAIIEMATAFEHIKPDIVLTVADRYETIATAIAASYMNIRVAHTQGGEITGSIDESVRHAVTKLSHLHFPATKHSANNIIQLGEDPNTVFTTGCPSIDLVNNTTAISQKVFDTYHGTGFNVSLDKPYLIVVQHPVTTEYGDGLRQINSTINAINQIGIRAIWLWPNIDAGSEDIAKGIRLFREKQSSNRIGFYKNFSPEHFAALLNSASCVVGNSSCGIRETTFLGTPSVNIGTRQNGRERGINVTDADYDTDSILSAIKSQLQHGRFPSNSLFGDGAAGQRISDVLATTDVKVQKQFVSLTPN
jgi:UDP-hydrolysing UDP-N-acetyl-D-glucosamine 2-epimerase